MSNVARSGSSLEQLKERLEKHKFNNYRWGVLKTRVKIARCDGTSKDIQKAELKADIYNGDGNDYANKAKLATLYFEEEDRPIKAGSLYKEIGAYTLAGDMYEFAGDRYNRKAENYEREENEDKAENNYNKARNMYNRAGNAFELAGDHYNTKAENYEREENEDKAQRNYDKAQHNYYKAAETYEAAGDHEQAQEMRTFLI